MSMVPMPYAVPLPCTEKHDGDVDMQEPELGRTPVVEVMEWEPIPEMDKSYKEKKIQDVGTSTDTVVLHFMVECYGVVGMQQPARAVSEDFSPVREAMEWQEIPEMENSNKEKKIQDVGISTDAVPLLFMTEHYEDVEMQQPERDWTPMREIMEWQEVPEMENSNKEKKIQDLRTSTDAVPLPFMEEHHGDVDMQQPACSRTPSREAMEWEEMPQMDKSNKEKECHDLGTCEKYFSIRIYRSHYTLPSIS